MHSSRFNAHRGRVAMLVLMVISALVFGGIPAEAAWPRLLMVYGKPLEKPIVVDDALGIVEVFDRSVEFEESKLKDRPYLSLALFWGMDWNRYVDEGTLDRLRPEDAKPLSHPTDGVPIRGKFYPTCGVAAAAIHLTAIGPNGERNLIWRVSAKGAKVLENFRVPLSVDCK